MAKRDNRVGELETELAELPRRLEACRAELEEAQAQQTATAEVLQVINNSPGDLAPVFDAMLEKAIRLCGGIQGALWTLDGGRPKLAATRGNTPEFVAMLREREPAELGPPEAVRLTMLGERLLHIPELVEHELYRAGDPITRAAVDLGGVRSLVGVALVKDGTPVGAFMIGRREARPFSDKQIALLQNFAAQAVIAMENARLINEQREALEQQTATAEVLQVINASPGNLAPVFDVILEKAHGLCGATYGSLQLFDGEKFRCVASHNLPAALFELLSQARRTAPNSPQERMLQGERIVHIADVAEIWTSPENEVARAAAEIGFTRTVLFVPLRKDSTLLGYITAARREVRPFADKQIALLQNFAAQALIAMENARLLTETREALEQQTATAEVADHQFLARRSRAGVRRNAGKGHSALRGRDGNLLDL
jgi:GAF domain-containing protein